MSSKEHINYNAMHTKDRAVPFIENITFFFLFFPPVFWTCIWLSQHALSLLFLQVANGAPFQACCLVKSQVFRWTCSAIDVEILTILVPSLSFVDLHVGMFNSCSKSSQHKEITFREWLETVFFMGFLHCCWFICALPARIHTDTPDHEDLEA